MRRRFWQSYCCSLLLLSLLFFVLLHQPSVVRCSATTAEKSSNLLQQVSVRKSNINDPPRSDSSADQPHHDQEEKNHNSSSGDLDSCLKPQQQQQQQQEGKREERKKPSRLSVDMDHVAVDARTTTAVTSKAAAAADGARNDDNDQDAAAAPVLSATAPTSVAGPEGGEEGDSNTNSGEDAPIPERYIVGCGGDRVEAARRWKKTLAWRKENKVDEVLETPQPRFHDCREVFPVFLHGRSRQGMPVLWERIGKVDAAKADELELPLPALTPNYVFLNECVWRLILDKGEDDNDDAKFITVEDVGGVRPWHLTPKVLSVLRSLTGTMKAHYVERCHKSYIINAPHAFTVLWRVVSAMLDPRTREKVSILGTNFLEEMQKEIDVSQIPTDYGGSSGRAMDDSDDERKIQALVARLNLAAEAEGTVAENS